MRAEKFGMRNTGQGDTHCPPGSEAVTWLAVRSVTGAGTAVPITLKVTRSTGRYPSFGMDGGITEPSVESITNLRPSGTGCVAIFQVEAGPVGSSPVIDRPCG